MRIEVKKYAGKAVLFLSVLFFMLCTGNSATFAETTPEEPVIPEKDEIVKVQTYIPDILVDLRYATTDNFTGEVIYDFTDAYLRYGTIEKLAAIQEQVKKILFYNNSLAVSAACLCGNQKKYQY